MFHGFCVVELPGAELAIGAAADAQNTEETRISFRLAPRNGVAAAWSSAEITVIDLDTKKQFPFKVLDTHPVTGRSLYPQIKEEHWVLYGPYSAAEFRLKPRIAKMELRFPPVLLDGRQVTVAPVRIDDGFRAPTLFFYHSH